MANKINIAFQVGIALVLSAAAFFILNPYPAIAEEKKAALSEKTPEKDQASMEEKWGIKVLSMRQTAEGYMLDFRYRVIDEKKAAPLFSHKIKPYLIDQATGAVMAVPDVPKVGSMRSTRKPLKDKNYAILFANPQKYIKPGSKVTVVIGDFRAENLVVE
jgi:hypothetical protein